MSEAEDLIASIHNWPDDRAKHGYRDTLSAIAHLTGFGGDWVGCKSVAELADWVNAIAIQGLRLHDDETVNPGDIRSAGLEGEIKVLEALIGQLGAENDELRRKAYLTIRLPRWLRRREPQR